MKFNRILIAAAATLAIGAAQAQLVKFGFGASDDNSQGLGAKRVAELVSSVLRAQTHDETHRHFCTTSDLFGSAGQGAPSDMLELLGHRFEPDHSGIARYVLRRFPVLRS